jgi:hypothetical protein
MKPIITYYAKHFICETGAGARKIILPGAGADKIFRSEPELAPEPRKFLGRSRSWLRSPAYFWLAPEPAPGAKQNFWSAPELAPEPTLKTRLRRPVKMI